MRKEQRSRGREGAFKGEGKASGERRDFSWLTSIARIPESLSGAQRLLGTWVGNGRRRDGTRTFQGRLNPGNPQKQPRLLAFRNQ